MWRRHYKEIVFMLVGVIVVGACLIIYIQEDNYLVCGKSETTGRTHCVRKDEDEAVEREKIERIAVMVDKLIVFVEYMKKEYPDDVITQRLEARFDPMKVTEIMKSSEDVAYSINKGEKIRVCLDEDDANTLMFVGLHEMAHIAYAGEGHNMEYWMTFKRILTEAEKIGVVKNVDYKKNPTSFCKKLINDNPYFDLD